MEFFRHLTQIDFMKHKNLAFILSLMICIGSLFVLSTKGLQLGLDFTGGTELQLHFNAPTDPNTIRTILSEHALSRASVQSYGSTHDILIQLPPQKETAQPHAIQAEIQQLLPEAQVMRLEYIGPQVGKDLVEQGVLAIVLSLMITMIYIALRFEMRFAISAAISLIHDPILILGIFSALQIEFDLIALAALLTVLGYSLNDTIVVYDRIRENFRLNRTNAIDAIVNASINQTLSRTIMTSGLTLLVVIALFLFGGEKLHGFAMALIVGIVIGTYSSIYIAGALAVVMGLDRKALMPKRTEPVDDLP
jgi:preprotein translocase subunit SecF